MYLHTWSILLLVLFVYIKLSTAKGTRTSCMLKL